MKTNPITEFNKEPLINISNQINLSDYSNEPVFKNVLFQDFSCIGNAIHCILSAIETIGFSGNKEDLAVCGGLAEIAKKLVPLEELEFLDKLLIEKEKFGEKIEFTPIENLKTAI